MTYQYPILRAQIVSFATCLLDQRQAHGPLVYNCNVCKQKKKFS